MINFSKNFQLNFSKRPTIEECLDHKWLLPNEFMTKKRESALFSSHKLSEFADEFHSAKSRSMPSRLASIAGIPLTRYSNGSIIFEHFVELYELINNNRFDPNKN